MEQKIDLFTPVHKAIRNLIYDTGKSLQTADFGDLNELERTLDALEHMLELLEEHARHEDQFIFPPIEKAAPGISRELEQQHVEGEQKVLRIKLLMNNIRSITSAEDRIAQSHYLNLLYTDFIAFYLLHMNREEETVLPKSIEHLSNEELTAIRVQVQLDTSPDQYTAWLNWMLPALNINELVPLYQQVRKSAPLSIYEKIKKVGQQVVPRDRWEKLCAMTEI